MTLEEYTQRIAELESSTGLAADLANDERKAALDLTAIEIEEAAWHAHTQPDAMRLAARARAAADALPGDRLDGLDGLARRRLLRAKI